MIDWPANLESCFLVADWREEWQRAAIMSEINAGFPESRETHSDPVVFVSGRIVISASEFDTLFNFYEQTLHNGCLRFRRTDPINTGISWEWRFREPPVVTALTGSHLYATITLERIPATDQ